MKKLGKVKLFYFILGILVSVTCTVLAYSYLAEDISFTPREEGWDVDNVQDALDSFRDIASHCPFGCEYAVGEPIIEASYSGHEEIVNIKCAGRFKLEVWGASGNVVSATYAHTGYGGYSVGTISLNEGDTLYINVGGAGASAIKALAAGGYNGGGNGKDYNDGRGAGGGGGATHIAKVSGLLYNLESFKGGYNNVTGVYVSDKIIIVAGGGGGVGNHAGLHAYNLIAGSGGGIVGVTGFSPGATNYYGYGGSQTEGGTCTSTSGVYQGTYGTFGAGGHCTNTAEGNCSGGGGGFYGGGSNTNYSGAAGGGSGYIGNASLGEKAMYCYKCTESDNYDSYTISTYGTTNHSDSRNPLCVNGYSDDPISGCAKEGNGYVRITYLGS